VRVAQFGDQTDLADELVAVTLAPEAHERDLQGDPDALYGVLGAPDFATASDAETALEAVLAQLPSGG
jgi:hypothetical protein